MIPSFVAKDAVRRVCREVAGGALIGMAAFLFSAFVGMALDAPSWLKVIVAACYSAFFGAYLAASLINNKF